MPLLSTRGSVSGAAYGITSGIAPIGDYELIGTVNIAANTATVTISSITQNFKNLQIRMQVNTTGSVDTDAWLQLNSVTSGYKRWWLQSNYSASMNGSGDTVGAFFFGLTPGNSETLVYSNAVFTISDYTNQRKFKTVFGSMTTLKRGAGNWWQQYISVMAPTKDPVTSITFGSATGNLRAGTTISLYGMRAN